MGIKNTDSNSIHDQSLTTELKQRQLKINEVMDKEYELARSILGGGAKGSGRRRRMRRREEEEEEMRRTRTKQTAHVHVRPLKLTFL